MVTKKRIYCVLVSVALLATSGFSQINARTGALLGNARDSTLIGGESQILMTDDVSDVFTFPSQVSSSTDITQAVAGRYVYASKAINGPLSLGLIFKKATILNNATNFYNDLSSLASPTFTIATGALTGSPLPIPFGGYKSPTFATAPGAGHLLLGFNLGVMNLGLDVFREASNTSFDSTRKDTGTVGGAFNTSTRKSIGSSSQTCLGGTFGLSMKVSVLMLKASAGLSMLDAQGEVTNSGNILSSIATGNVTYNTEKSTFITTGGTYIPISAKGVVELGGHKFTAGLGLNFYSYQFVQKYNDGDPGTTMLDIKSPEYSTVNLLVGGSDEWKLANNTLLLSSIEYIRQSTTTTPNKIYNTQGNRENTTVTTTFPRFSLGLERVIDNVWKFDHIALRAGGAKAIVWNSINEKGENGSTFNHSDAQRATGVPDFTWTTGVGFTVGNFDIGMTIDPGTYNGVYFLNGKGPVGGLITFTYNLGTTK